MTSLFVAFEGIDGSGKTTVSAVVARLLRERGITVHHLREDGKLASPLSQWIRDLGRDVRNLDMAPVTELLLMAARDAQLGFERARPALAEGGVVICDRWLYSAQILAERGRQLDPKIVRPVLDTASGGLWPAVVILLDVDPHVARARRQLRKLAMKLAGTAGGGGRKGLAGVGLHHRLREGYLALAASDPDRWLVLDNSGGADLDDLARRATEVIAGAFGGQPPAALVRAAADRGRTRARAAEPTLAAAADAFYQFIAARAADEPGLAAHFLSGMTDDRAWSWREKLLDVAPAVIADGLRGLNDERAWALRERLLPAAARAVARSLDGREVEGPRAEHMRERLVDAWPDAVLAGVDGVDTPAAWAIRERLAGEHLRAVTLSLKRLGDERAWALRDRYLAAAGGERKLHDPDVAGVLAASLRGLGDERAWALREQTYPAAPVDALASLDGLLDDRSWQWRHDRVVGAPKVVLRTFDAVDDPRAWALRDAWAERAKETMDSITGMDGEPAWRLRDRCVDLWPSTVMKSIGPLIDGARARALAARLIEAYPSNLSLLKHATRMLAGPTGGPGAVEVGE